MNEFNYLKITSQNYHNSYQKDITLYKYFKIYPKINQLLTLSINYKLKYTKLYIYTHRITSFYITQTYKILFLNAQIFKNLPYPFKK